MKTPCKKLFMGRRSVSTLVVLSVIGVLPILAWASEASGRRAGAGRASGVESARFRSTPADWLELLRSKAAASSRWGWSHPPKTAASPCRCQWTKDAFPAYPHFAEVEVTVDERRTIERLRALPRAPGSRLEILDGGQRVKAQWYATAVGELIEEGAQVNVLRDFILSEKPARSTQRVPKGISATAECSGQYLGGTNNANYYTTEYQTLDYNYTWSDIYISGALSNAVVTCIDVHYEIVYPYAGDLSVSVSDENVTETYVLFDDEYDTSANPSDTVTGITDFAGEGVNQYWSLWVFDWYWEEDDGYIDSWWIKVYYTVPAESPANDACADAVTLQNGVSYQGTTVGATGDYETWCSYYDMLDVWHVFTATQTGPVTISAQSAEFDATLSVFDQCGGTELACSDDRCDDDTNPQIVMRVTAGTSYYIRVAGYDYRTGDYSLTVTQEPLDLPDEPSQPSPLNVASGVSTHPVLSWNDSAALASMAKSRDATSEIGRDAEAMPKVIYGKDDRVEEYEVTNPNFLTAGDATVILVFWAELTDNGNGTYTLPSETFAYWYEDFDPLDTGNPLCADEPFRNQPAPGVCSGVLVAPDLIATAGHCVACSNISDFAVVFGFVMQDASTPALTVSAEDVYRCSEIVAYSEGYPDWSLVRLQRQVTGHTPLPLQRTGSIMEGQELLVIGHPWGLPRKYDAGGTVRDATAATFFQANVDTYIGNSGSPVLDRDSMEVLGVITAGMESFEIDNSFTCDRSRICPDTGCPGWEDISRASTFSAFVPSFDVYLGTSPGSLSLVSAYGVVPWYRPGQLQANTTYYWRIVARNAWGTTQGPLWSFQTGSAPAYSPIYRFWSPSYLHHFYTISEAEKDAVIANWSDAWTYESVGFQAFPSSSQAGLAPVYRFWSPLYNSHFYTISEAEKNAVIATWPSSTWTYETVAFYAYPEGSQPAGASPVYRFWSNAFGGHFYTISETEKDYIIANFPTWQYESIAWYAYE